MISLSFVNHKNCNSQAIISEEQECFWTLLICILIKDPTVDFERFYLDHVWTSHMLTNKTECFLMCLKKKKKPIS